MLSNEQIREHWNNYSPTKGIESFARAIEAEVRKQDDALIQQLVEALEGSIPIAMGKAEQRNTALIAARARLGEKT